MALSSSGPGRRPLTAKTRVRLPLRSQIETSCEVSASERRAAGAQAGPKMPFGCRKRRTDATKPKGARRRSARICLLFRI